MTVKKDWGLVLAGGGGKGAYEIGAWKAIRERKDLHISAVSGTSVGALNAALFCAGDYKKAQCIWENQINEEVVLTPGFLKKKEFPAMSEEILKENRQWILEIQGVRKLAGRSGRCLDLVSGKRAMIHKLESVFDRPLAEAAVLLIGQLVKHGVFTREGLIRIIRENGMLPGIRKSRIPCYATCYNIMNQSAEYFLLQQYKEEEILNILLASSALPFIFPPEEIGGIKYWDGGLKDNLPVEPLYQAGYRKILVVHLSKADDDLFSETESAFKGSQCVSSAGRAVCYRDAVLVHIYPQKSLAGFRGTLDFRPETIQRKMDQGYIETKKRLERVMG